MSPEEPPPPPWEKYPGSEMSWGGWRQGVSEHWLLDTWLPFWRALSRSGRTEYLRRWPPPDEGWRERVDGWAET